MSLRIQVGQGGAQKVLALLISCSLCWATLLTAPARAQEAGQDVRPAARTPRPGTDPGRSAATTRPAVTTRPATATRPAETRPADAAKPKLIPLSFNNAGMNDVARFLNDQLGKPVIVSEEVSTIQVMLVNPKQLPAPEALGILATALHQVGVAIEEGKETVQLIPIAQVAQSRLQTVGADVDLKTLPVSQIVRYVFPIRQTDPAKLVDIVKPMLPTYAVVTADSASGKLMVVATVERLMVVESVLRELDVTGMAGGELRVFPIKNVDVYEIIPVLEKLVAGYLGVEVKSMAAPAAHAPADPA